MKKPITALAAASIVFFAAACSDEKKTETQQVAIIDSPATAPVVVAQGPVSVTPEQVPDTVKKTFMAKFPKASSPVWYSYTAVPEDEMDMSISYYYVNFSNSSDQMSAWYDTNGNWVKTSTRIKGDSRLPDAVNKMLADKYPGYKIDELDKENDKDMDMYEIKLLKGEDKVKLKVLPNGTIFKRK